MSVCVPFLYPVSFSLLCLSLLFVSLLSPCLPCLPVCVSSLLVCLSPLSVSVRLSVSLLSPSFYVSLFLFSVFLCLSPSLWPFCLLSVCLNLSPLSLSPRSPYLSRSPLLVYVYVRANSFPASPLFYRHPSIQNTILPNKVLLVSALSLTRLQLSGTYSLFLSAILPLSPLLNLP